MALNREILNIVNVWLQLFLNSTIYILFTYRYELDFIEAVIMGMNIDSDNSTVGLLGYPPEIPFLYFDLKEHSKYCFG